jgi:phosphonate transport system ATP-binding protein
MSRSPGSEHVELERVCLDVRTRSGPLRVLDDVTLRIGRHERVALLGASGSGKSTLLRVIAGLQELAPLGSGVVRIDGVLLQDGRGVAPGAREVRARIGLVFQQFQLAQRLDLLTNVLVGALARQPLWRRLARRFSDDERVRGMRALAEVGLADRATQRTSTLSGGQQQRAAIGRALVQGGQLLLADEPVASLDPTTARQVLDLMDALHRDHGTTLIAALHQPSHARERFDRAIALAEGRVVYDGPSSELTDELLEQIYSRSRAPAAALDGETPLVVAKEVYA